MSINNKESEEISFGEWLRQRRRMLDLTQQAFADQVGCARITLRRIESGARKPSKELAHILLHKLSIPEIEHPQWVLFARGVSGFPAKSSNSFPSKPLTNLPAPLTSFIGREKEQIEILTLISKYRLVTLVGSGGVGKTRLSLKIGKESLEDYAHGVWLVELAPILDPLLVPRTTAIALGQRDEPQRPVIDLLVDYLREKKMLIILDNCEHILDACTQLANTLLKNCPNLKILATSREALGILGESIYHVRSLALPDIQKLPEELRDYDSVCLFEERAQLAQMDFMLTIENAHSVAKICTYVDGIPLAIELAAARVSMFSTEQIAARLQKSFDLLTGGSRIALPRHQTLQAAIDWSYDLLSTAEQILLQRLSVFVKGWTLEAVEAVSSDAKIKSEDVLVLLAQLISKSLVNMEEIQGKARYSVLETIRRYANKKLVESGKRDLVCDRHLEYFLHLAETAEPHLIRPEQIKWLPLLDADYENLRLALEWALSRESAESSLNLCRALGWFWEIRCYWMEGLSWLKRALAKPMRDTNKNEKVARTRALYTRAMFEWQLGNSDPILPLAEASLALALEASDKRDIAIAKFFLAAALLGRKEDGDPGRSLLEQSFAEFQELNEVFWQARVFQSLGYFLATPAESNYQDLLLRSIELARKAGERLILADALSEYAQWLFRVNQVNEAKKHVEESERLYKQIGSENTSINPFLFAEIALSNGDHKKARSLYIELEQRFRLLGAKGFRSNCIGKLGLLAMEEGDLDGARAYLEEALMLERDAGSKPGIAFYLIELGNLFYLQGNIIGSRQNFRESLSSKNYFREYHKTYFLMTMLGSLYIQKPESAARLLGVINNYEGKFDLPRTPVDKRYCRRAEAHAREMLGNAAFESAFVEGQKMSLDEALDLALKTIDETTCIYVAQDCRLLKK